MMFSWLMQLTACASAKKRLTAKFGAQHLERDPPPQPHVLGDEHAAHAASPDLLQQAIRAEHRTHRIGPAGIAGGEGARRFDAGAAEDVRDSVIVIDDIVLVILLARCLAGATV
jgi:hypothetical protein